MTTIPSPVKRSFGSQLLAYCIAFPLFGRAVFPIVRDKSGITLMSSFTDPQMAATYLLGLILMVRLAYAGQVLQGVNLRTFRFLVLFIVVAICSAVNSRLPLFSVWRCFEVTLLTLWSTAMVQDASAANDPARAVRTFYVISVAILVAVLVGLVLNPNGAWAMEGDVARLSGTTGYMINANDIGTIAAVIAVGAYVRAIEFRRIPFYVATVFFGAICYFSHSRASYIALTLGLLCANMMVGRVKARRVAIWASTLFVLLAICVLIAVSSSLRDYLVFLMTRGHDTDNLEGFGGRLQLWEFGLNVYKQHPFLGTGYGTYPEGLEGGHFHNIFIELLVTTGLTGVLIYVIFLVDAGRIVKNAVSMVSARDAVQRTLSSDLLTIPAVILVANVATAGAAYFTWDLLGLICVAAAAASLSRSSSISYPIMSEVQPVRPPNVML